MIDIAKVRALMPGDAAVEFVAVRRGLLEAALREIEAGRRALAQLAAIGQDSARP